MFYLVRLRGDYSFTDWLVDEKNVTGALVPGRYVASCLLRDPLTGKSHAELGMLRLITVTEAAK